MRYMDIRPQLNFCGFLKNHENMAKAKKAEAIKRNWLGLPSYFITPIRLHPRPCVIPVHATELKAYKCEK